MSIVFYVVYTILHLALLIWGLFVWRRTRRASTFVVIAVTFGLVYDNFVLSLGSLLDHGSLLYALSIPRFVLHQLILPWIVWTTFEQVRLAGHRWAQGVAAKRIVILSSVVLVVLGILTGIVPLDLQPAHVNGINRYVDEGAVGPPVASIVSIVFAMVMGVLLWRKNRWPWVFLTAAAVFVGEGIPVEFVRRLAGSGVEVLFMMALLVTEERVETMQQIRSMAVHSQQTREKQ